MYSQSGLESLREAIKTKDFDAVRDVFLKNPSVLRPTDNRNDLPKTRTVTARRTLLWEAILDNHEEFIELLIELGADVNEEFDLNCTFLHAIVIFGSDKWQRSKKVVQSLILRGANVNAHSRDWTKKTPLQMALEEGFMEYAKFLLNHGAKLENPLSRTLAAPKIRQKEILEFLIKRHVIYTDFYSQEYGRNYLHMTIAHAVHNPDSDIDIVGIAKIFLNHGVQVNDMDNSRQSVLYYAFVLKNIELIRLLVERGADVNNKNMNGDFPLYLAAKNDYEELLEFLILNGAEINANNNNGWTALHMACCKRSEKTIKLLLQSGAEITIENTGGKTPFMLMYPQEYHENDVPCIKLLVKEIAKRMFFNHPSVSTKDINTIQAHPIMEEFFQICTKELSQMASTKFYPPYSYCCVLKMWRKINKLANLTKNEEFVASFEKNLLKFGHYKNELEEILNKAVTARDNSLIVESSLKSMFGNCFPDVIIRKLADNLVIKDLILL